MEEFLTLMELRQEIIDEINSINKMLDSYPGIDGLTLHTLNPPPKGVTFAQTVMLEQIVATNAEITKIFLIVQELEEINNNTVHNQLASLRKELVLLQSSKARQTLYDQLPAQYTGAFVDRKK